jgi:hypothetical protein
MQQQDTMKKTLIMKCKAKNWEFKFANEQAKRLKTNKHKIQKKSENTPRGNEMIDAIEWLC